MKTWQSLKLNENQMIFLWRPLLKVSKQELLNYLNGISVEYIADPSNFSNDFLRNWLRNEWLPQLEQKVSGSVKSFARSLEILTESIQGNEELDPIDLLIQSVTDDFQLDKNGQPKIKYFVRRIDLLALSISQRKQCIVKLLKRANIDKISSGQVNEILKQLDNPQKMHKFGFNNCVWVVDAERVFVE
jgi:tRNA(Ile)-lysidine synthase TilS/MesJ